MHDEDTGSYPLKRVPIKGRGAASNADSRYAAYTTERVDDGWWPEDLPPSVTQVTREQAKSIISRNDSPDIPFEQSINPYRGCEHGCSYCYARPSHAYLGLSPGLDFETRLWAKPDAAERLTQALSRPGYRVSPIALGANTDPYQPIERHWQITRQILEVLCACRHPVSITTKSALIERDQDLLASMAEQGLVQVQISITTLDRHLARLMEPRATSPARRLQAMAQLRSAGIPVSVMVAPIIPVLTDSELETILARAAEAGATRAGYIMLRLPLELETLFREWLDDHYPSKAEHVWSLVKSMHAGQVYQSGFHQRQKGSGAYAGMIAQRFRLSLRRSGLEPTRLDELNGAAFIPPRPPSPQFELF